MAVTFAQPTDVVKVRFQAQTRLPDSGAVKRYSSTMEAYRTIARDEGVKGLWKGEARCWETNKSPNMRTLCCLTLGLGLHLSGTQSLNPQVTFQTLDSQAGVI